MTAEDRIIDWTLGELPDDLAREVGDEVARRPEAALQAAEVHSLLEQMRTLTVTPSGRVPVAIGYALARRQQLRDGRGVLRFVGATVRVAAVAVVVLGGLLLWQEAQSGRVERAAVSAGAQDEMPVIERSLVPAVPAPTVPAPTVAAPASLPWLADDDVLVAGGSSLRRHHAELEAIGQMDMFSRLVRANNELAMLRLEYTQRYSRRARRESIERCGGKPDLEDRIQALAAAVSERLLARLAAEPAPPAGDVALALRALLASGSTQRIGRHRAAVTAALDHLQGRVGALAGGELAAALAALTDFAVVSGGQAAALVAEHGERLALATLRRPSSRRPHSAPQATGAHRGGEQERPALLRFQTPVAHLADAGYVLRLAPAFGVHPILARRARLLVGAHLAERADGAGERPDVASAMLYGFGDLVTRRELDQRLLLWRPELLAGEDLVALHHLSWSQFPPRPGWAEFQRELRTLATWKTPEHMRDASALLLSLAMNFAAPGVHQVLDLAG